MKYSGIAGFEIDEVEQAPGVYTSGIITKSVRGDIIQPRRITVTPTQNSVGNRDFRMSNTISLVASEFLNTHISSMVYLTVRGVKYRVEDFSIGTPRITVTLGAVYHEIDRTPTDIT